MTTDSDARVLAVLGLADDVPTVDDLATYLVDPDVAVRRTALHVLAESAPADAGAALARALLDDDGEVRTAAIEGLLELRELVAPDAAFCAALGAAAVAPDPVVRALTLQLQREHRLGDEGLFARALEDDDAEVRRHGIAGLVAVGGWEAIATARHDDEAVVRLAAARALGTVGHRGAVEALGALSADEDPRVRAAAFESFAAVGCPPDLAALAIAALSHVAWAVRKGAALALAAAPAEMAVRPLIVALGDVNLDVRKAAVQSLAGWAGRLDEVAVALGAMVDDPDADVRAFARMAMS